MFFCSNHDSLLAAARIALFGFCAMAQGSANAQTRGAADLSAVAQVWLTGAVTGLQSKQQAGLRTEVIVGAVDGRLKLAPCEKVEPYLPVGSRLWGRSRVGLRCTDGAARWNVTLPMVVNAWGPAWVVKRHISAGIVLSVEDVIESEVNWAEDPAPVLGEPALWLGQVAARQLVTGQTLREGMVKPAQVFSAGSQVRVIVEGPGFRVASDGQALSAGTIGQAAKVRMDNGRVANGLVLDVRTVKVDL